MHNKGESLTLKPASTTTSKFVTLRDVFSVWWPLALSWLLMSVEGPAHSSVVSRLADPEIHLAAWGGIVFPLSLLFESPIVMMLSASTALSKDVDSYKKLRHFMLFLGVTLSVIHIICAFTPLYDIIVRQIIGAPEAIIEPGRIGLRIMVPWAWAIGFRRLHQGIMIRYGYTRAVGIGTMIRLTANAVVLSIGYVAKSIPGIVVASSAVATGVVAEAIYAGLRTRPMIQQHIQCAPMQKPALTLSRFLRFYIPLALTTMISFFVSPLGSAAMSRMPEPLVSLAIWPVLYGLVFILRSPCMAFNEVVISVIDRPHSLSALRRFAGLLALGATILTLTIAATPLANLWLGRVMALPPNLLSISRTGLWLAVFLPALVLLQNWYQGLIVSSHATRGVTEAVILYIVTVGILLFIGVQMQLYTGIFVTIGTYEIAAVMQSGWLWLRSRPALKAVQQRDALPAPVIYTPDKVS